MCLGKILAFEHGDLKLINNDPSIVAVIMLINTVSWHHFTPKELSDVFADEGLDQKVAGWVVVFVGGDVQDSAIKDTKLLAFSNELVELFLGHGSPGDLKDVSSNLLAQESSVTPLKTDQHSKKEQNSSWVQARIS